MTFRSGITTAAAATMLALAPASGQQAGSTGSGDQALAQEQTQDSGASLELSPTTVRQVQEALNQQGYDVGQVDGAWSQQTAQALQNFQRAQGLEPTGQLNQNTLSALGIGSAQGNQVITDESAQ